MHNELDLTDVKPLKLSQEQQDKVVKYIKETFGKGKRARQKYEDHWQACEDAYECEPPPLLDDELDWKNNSVLPWAYDAVESWHAHMHQTMLPREDRIFNIRGVTREDDPGAEVMEKYLDHIIDKIDFHTTFGKILKHIGKKNHSAVKVYWQKKYRTYHRTDELNGRQAKLEEQKLIFNAPKVDTIDLPDFVMYPIYGELEETTVIHETYKYYQDLVDAQKMSGAPYFNLDQISADDEAEHQQVNSFLEDNEKKQKEYGLKIKEAWVHRIQIDGQTYKNYIATVVNDKWLIRFEPNPFEDGRCPFYFMSLKPDGLRSLYGYGLLSKGLDLLHKASQMFNQKADELEIKLHPPNIYYNDGVFNPYNVISRPGAQIEVSQDGFERGNIRPLFERVDHLNLAYSEIAELKAEFESVTVPKVVKGMIETGDRTATEISNVQNNSSGKMHIEAHTVNKLLKWVIEQIYTLIYERVMQGDKDLIKDIARITQESTATEVNPETGEETVVPRTDEEMVEDLPEVLPLPEVDIKVVGYQNWVRKQETLAAIGQVSPQLIQTPAAKYHNWYNFAETAYKLADVNPQDVLVDSDKAREMDEQEAQASQKEQDLLIQQEAMKLQLEQQKQQIEEFKAQSDANLKGLNLELDAREVELKYQAQLEGELLNAITSETKPTAPTKEPAA